MVIIHRGLCSCVLCGRMMTIVKIEMSFHRDPPVLFQGSVSRRSNGGGGEEEDLLKTRNRDYSYYINAVLEEKPIATTPHRNRSSSSSALYDARNPPSANSRGLGVPSSPSCYPGLANARLSGGKEERRLRSSSSLLLLLHGLLLLLLFTWT